MSETRMSDRQLFIEERIGIACQKVQRDRNSVTLIAVSKTQPIERLQEAYELGLKDFGENKVQEIMSKFDLMPVDSRFHMIGHLQTNKVRQVIDKVKLIHSVDSLKLAKVIHQEAKKKGIVCDILIEVNLGEEETKFGVSIDETLALIEEIRHLDGLKIKGLMTVAPFVDDPESNREIFRALKQLSVDINNKNLDNVLMQELSMGMTNDFEIAIEEGATLIRIGTALFGERNYTKR